MSKVKVKKVKPEDFSPQAYFVHYEDKMRYRITPKGFAFLAMMDSDIEINEDKFNYFWDKFCFYLKASGYTRSQD